MPTYGKVNLFFIKSISLVFSFREMQRRLMRTKLCNKCFYSTWIETSHKPSKVAAAKDFLPNVYVIGTACFDECFLFHVIIGRHYVSYKFIVTQGFFASIMLLRFLKGIFWKKSVFYVRYLHNTIIMLISKVQTKASTY